MKCLAVVFRAGVDDRNAIDQLLFKMQRDGELVRIKRGVYALPDKIGKKERREGEAIES